MEIAVISLTLPLLIVTSWKILYCQSLIVRAEDYLFGASVLLVGLGVCAWYSPSLSRYFVFGIVILSASILVWQLFRNFPKVKRFRLDSSMYIFLGLCTFFFNFVFFGRIYHRFFVNPDPFGYAAVTGLIKKFDGLPQGLASIEEFTGVPFSYSASWTDPTQFRLIDSPFLIPDFLIKYGVSNGMFFHNAGSVIGLLFGDEAPKEFFIMWAVVTTISISLVIALSYRACALLFATFFASPELGQKRNKSKKVQQKQSQSYVINSNQMRKVSLLSFTLIVAMFLGSVWLLPMLWEGYLNQFLSYALTLGVLVVSLRVASQLSTEQSEIRPKIGLFWRWNFRSVSRSSGSGSTSHDFVDSSLKLIFFILANVVTYAQQIPWQILAFTCVILFQGWNWLFSSIKNVAKTIIVISMTTVLAFFLPQTRRGLSMFSGGGESAGGSMHLGAFNPTRVFVPILNLELAEVSDPGHDGSQFFTELPWLGSVGNGYAYNLRGQGYNLVAEPISGMYAASFSLILIIFALIKLGRLPSRFFSFAILCFVLIAANIFYLYTHSGLKVLDNPKAAFNDYLWVRLWAVTSIFYIPILVALSSFIIYQYFLRSMNLMIGISLFFLVTSAFYVHQYSRSLERYSIDASVIDSCPAILQSEDQNYYVSDVVVPVLGISVCGQSMDFLSDTFPSTRGPAGERNVIEINRDVETDSWQFEKIGTLELIGQLTSPCNKECVISLPGYKPISNGPLD